MYAIGSLFSGIGGIELGFERTGAFKTVWFVEKDRYAQSVIKKHWRDAIIYDDITRLDFRTVSKIDILTGGFPCQDISTGGAGVGIQGSRSSLWKYYKEAIGILLPKIAFIENVPMLTDRGFDVVLSNLAEMRYDAEWYCVSSSSIGKNHRRERLFIIAYDNSIRRMDNEVKEFRMERKEQTQYEVEPSSRWDTKSRICGVDDGISCWVDRLRCLGNSVDPQVSEVFAEAIKERLN